MVAEARHGTPDPGAVAVTPAAPLRRERRSAKPCDRVGADRVTDETVSQQRHGRGKRARAVRSAGAGAQQAHRAGR